MLIVPDAEFKFEIMTTLECWMN